MALFSRKKNIEAEARSFYPENIASVSRPMLFTADSNPTVSAVINKITSTLTSLPLNLYVHTKSGKSIAYQHPLYRILKNPAQEETPSLFYGALIRSLLGEGNAYIYTPRNAKGEVVGLSIIDPLNVRVTRTESFRKIFTINSTGQILTEREVLHIPYNGAGYNGTLGVSPVKIHKELIELHNEMLSYVNNYFDNSVGSRIGLELGSSYPTKLGEMDKIYAAIVPVFNKFVVGARNAGKPMIALPDTKLTKIEQPSNAEAELHSLFATVEKWICYGFNVPYEVIDSSASKYASLEQKQADFLSNCIEPLGRHICESFEKLIDNNTNNLYFIEYEYKNLLTTNVKDTIDYLSKEVQSGLMTINEARYKLGMEDIGDEGDYHFMPSNLMPVTMENIEAYMAKSKIAIEQAKNTDDHAQNGDDKI